MDRLGKERFPSEGRYNAGRFWEDLMESRGHSSNSLLVGQFNRCLARARAGEFGPGERRITELLLERSESSTQTIPRLNPFFNTLMAKLKDEQSWKQEIPLVAELLLCGVSDSELQGVYQGLLGMHVNQTENQEFNAVLYEVWDLMVAKGFASDPNDPRI